MSFKNPQQKNNYGNFRKPFNHKGSFKHNKDYKSTNKQNGVSKPEYKGYVELNFEPPKKLNPKQNSAFTPETHQEEFLLELWKKEREYLQNLKTEQNDVLNRSIKIVDTDTLNSVGIKLPDSNKPLGFIKYHPADFIVEEITQDNEIININVEKNNPDLTDDKDKHWQADLVKMGISTLDAVKEIANTLKIPSEFIGFAGLKDDIAITSQRISVRKTRPQLLSQISNKHFFLKNITPAKRHIKKGELNGNRFTILVRTEKPVDLEIFNRALEEIGKNGFWNFYWLQRFGNRTQNHKLGNLVLRGNYRQAVHSQLFDTSPASSKLINDLREKGRASGGNWKQVRTIYSKLPYTFRYELLLLDYLIQHPGDYAHSLLAIPELISLWVYAYSSYVANEKISELALNNQNTRQIPLLMSNDRTEILFYEKELKRDKIPLDFSKYINIFHKNIKLTPRSLPTKVKPAIHSYNVFNEGFIICFDLPKGAYATTFLGHIFTLLDDKTAPNWISEEIVDSKQALSIGEISETYSKFGEFEMDRDLWQHY